MSLIKSQGKILLLMICMGLLLVPQVITVRAQPPTQAQVFNGHTFSENYWDIMVFNNSKWNHPLVSKEISWYNNTWNIKWIKEGNFEMGMLAFMNKSDWDENGQSIWVTPAQLFWMHYYLNGHEILIADVLTAWFGFSDSDHNRDYTDGENITPFFYMGQSNKEMRDTVGIISHPSCIIKPLSRDASTPNIITYSWAYNYTDIIFYLPHINHTTKKFLDGWNYTDPGSYIGGSEVIGNQTYIAYQYNLVLNGTAKKASLSVNYNYGDLGILKYYDEIGKKWILVKPGDLHYMPKDWVLCTAHWAFIMAGMDEHYVLTTPTGSAINTSIHKTGLTTVSTQVEGNHAFDFAFSSKPTYSIENLTDPLHTPHTYSAAYESLDIKTNQEFIKFVSGMTQLIGSFGQLIISYAINQTNHFVNGIPFEKAWANFDPTSTAALFIVGYPEYGQYQGGRIVHDPLYIAYYSTGNQIPAFPLFLVWIAIFFAVSVTIRLKKTQKL